MKRTLISLIAVLGLLACASAQKGTVSRGEGSVTFTLDQVSSAIGSIGTPVSGSTLAKSIHDPQNGFSDEAPTVLACSFADENLQDIGEDVLFQMLLQAWCQHRPVVLTPDAVWMVISQGFSHWVNENPELVRETIVSHKDKKEIRIETNNLYSDEADWEGLVGGFCAQIAKYTAEGTASLVADFSTTGTTEKIASEITLMDAVKPYFNYTSFYAICGIPYITLTGTPEDWEKVLEKTRTLSRFGLKWWVNDLDPILEEFVEAAKGKPDYWFWKDIVSKTRPRRLQGPSCSPNAKPITMVDGWFLKLFPFCEDGRTPESVPINFLSLAETVCVPFRYDIVNAAGEIIRSDKMEMVAGIVGVEEDPETFALTPRIGWMVRIPAKKDNPLAL